MAKPKKVMEMENKTKTVRWKIPKEGTAYLQKLQKEEKVVSVAVVEDMKFIELILEDNEE